MTRSNNIKINSTFSSGYMQLCRCTCEPLWPKATCSDFEKRVDSFIYINLLIQEYRAYPKIQWLTMLCKKSPICLCKHEVSFRKLSWISWHRESEPTFTFLRFSRRVFFCRKHHFRITIISTISTLIDRRFWNFLRGLSQCCSSKSIFVKKVLSKNVTDSHFWKKFSIWHFWNHSENISHRHFWKLLAHFLALLALKASATSRGARFFEGAKTRCQKGGKSYSCCCVKLR